MYIGRIGSKSDQGNDTNANVHWELEEGCKFTVATLVPGDMRTIPTCLFGTRLLLNKYKGLSDLLTECSTSREISEMHVEPFLTVKNIKSSVRLWSAKRNSFSSNAKA